MVLYKVGDLYVNDILKVMHDHRNTVYDITLKVGNEKLYAHKAVLLTGSDYFKSMFVGPFADKNKSEIDLTDLTDRADLLETVISFLYFGEIEIHEMNIEMLMKLSSFMIISKLQGFCTEFIVNNLNIRSSLRYYFSALHGFPDLERKIGNILQSRFHDYIIFHEEAVSLSPKELSHLLDKDFLKFCRVLDLLNFLLKWISATKDKESQLHDEHLSFLCQFMEYVASVDKDRSERNNCEKQFSEIQKVSDELGKMGSDVAKTFQKQIEMELKFFQTEPEARSRNVRQSKSDCLMKLKLISGSWDKPKQKKKPEQDLEDAVILLCPMHFLLDKEPEKYMAYCFKQFVPVSKSFEEPILDVLAFIPRQKTWYYVNYMYDQCLMNLMLRDTGDSSFTQVGDRTFYLHEEDSEPISFLLEDSYSRGTRYRDIHEPDEPGMVYSFRKSGLVVVNGSVYVVHLFSIFPAGDDSDDIDDNFEYCFCCSKLLSDGTWEIVFMTEKFRYDISSSDDHIFVSYSDRSKEMIFAYYCGRLICCYVVDMFSRGGPEPLRVFPEEGMEWPAPDEAKKWWDARIIEGKDRFNIVELEHAYKKGLSVKQEHRGVFCTHEYVFGSHVLTPSNKAKIGLDYQVRDFKRSKGMFIRYECIAPDANATKSVWVVDGNEKDVSSLQEVMVEDGELKVRAHIPPPTCYVRAVFAAKLSPEFLEANTYQQVYFRERQACCRLGKCLAV